MKLTKSLVLRALQRKQEKSLMLSAMACDLEFKTRQPPRVGNNIFSMYSVRVRVHCEIFAEINFK